MTHSLPLPWPSRAILGHFNSGGRCRWGTCSSAGKPECVQEPLRAAASALGDSVAQAPPQGGTGMTCRAGCAQCWRFLARPARSGDGGSSSPPWPPAALLGPPLILSTPLRLNQLALWFLLRRPHSAAEQTQAALGSILDQALMSLCGMGRRAPLAPLVIVALLWTVASVHAAPTLTADLSNGDGQNGVATGQLLVRWRASRTGAKAAAADGPVVYTVVTLNSSETLEAALKRLRAREGEWPGRQRACD